MTTAGLAIIGLLAVQAGGLFEWPAGWGPLEKSGTILLNGWTLAFWLLALTSDDTALFLSHQAGRLVLASLIVLSRFSAAALLPEALSSLLPDTRTVRGILLASIGSVEGFDLVSRALKRRSRPPAGLSLARMTPLTLMLLTFPALILAGTVLLVLPRARAAGAGPILWHDALFTATSAVCVTGLTVRDTALHFSSFGQNVILGLIQLGGLGIVTFASFFTLLLGDRSDLGHEAAVKDIFSGRSFRQVIHAVIFIVTCTAAIELGGAFLLMDAWHLPDTCPFWERFRYSFFHSVAAFCNAGFSIESDNLGSYARNPAVLTGIAALILLGGIGFPTLQEILMGAIRWIRNRLRRPGVFSPASGSAAALSLQSRLAIRMSLILIAAGALLLFFVEYGRAFSTVPEDRWRFANALFLSISTRTAGFDTVALDRFSDAALFFMILLMFVGASPSSTGGGIKTTTTAVLYASVRAIWKNREEVEISRRSLTRTVVQGAVVILILSALIVTFSSFLLALLHPEFRFIDVLFETTSAFGTVGLSTGITPKLGVMARLLVCLTMLAGRLGPLTIMVAIAKRRKGLRYAYAAEEVAVG